MKQMEITQNKITSKTRISNKVQLNLISNCSLGTCKPEFVWLPMPIVKIQEKFSKKIGSLIIMNNEVGGLLIGTLTSFSVVNSRIEY